MMVCFIFGVSLVFGFIEEIGYMARCLIPHLIDS